MKSQPARKIGSSYRRALLVSLSQMSGDLAAVAVAVGHCRQALLFPPGQLAASHGGLDVALLLQILQFD